MEFKEVKLGEISNINMGQSPRSEFYSEFEGTPFLQGNRTFQHIYPLIDTYTNKITKLANKNDILFSVRAPVGDMNIAPVDLCIGRGLCAINSTNSNQEFLFYLLKSKLNELESHSTGTIFSSVNKKTLENFIVKVPSDSHQKNIGRLLSNLDKKIEINQNIIANLEELSQTLFKRWFVDFEFPDENDNPYKSSGGEMIDSELGKIPKDWKIKKLDDLLNLIIDHRGKTPKKLGSDWSEKGMPAISAKNIKNRKLVNVDKIKFINRETYVKWMKNEVEKGDIILTSEAPLGETYLINEDSKWVLSQRLYAMRTNESLNYIYFWEYVNSHYFQNELTKRSSGSTVTGIRQKELIQILVIVPPLKFQKKYFEILNPLVDDITRRNNEITMLTQLRDTLLPKLMSGEIEIPDDIEVNEDELSI